MKKKVFVLTLLLVAAVLIITLVMKNTIFDPQIESEIKQSEFSFNSNHNKYFLNSQLPEIKWDYEKALEEAETDENAHKRQMKEFDEIKKRKDKLKNKTELDDPAIVVGDEIITKRDIENMKIDIEYAAEYLITDKQDKLKYDITKLVQAMILKKEVERRTNMPSQTEIDEEINMQRTMYKNLDDDDEYKEKYFASKGMSEKEFWELIEENCIYLLREKEWDGILIEENREEIEREASRKDVTVEEYMMYYYIPFKIDELVSKAEIEILDPELKALFGIAE